MNVVWAGLGSWVCVEDGLPWLDSGLVDMKDSVVLLKRVAGFCGMGDFELSWLSCVAGKKMS